MKNKGIFNEKNRRTAWWIFAIFCIVCASIFSFFNGEMNEKICTKNFEKATEATNFNCVPNLTLTSEETSTKQGVEAIEEARKSVVEVSCEGFGIKMAGSGVLIGKSTTEEMAFVVTNYHIIQNAQSASIRLFDDFEIKNVKVIGYSTQKDLAVLSFDCENYLSKLHFATIRDTTKSPLLLAEEVFAIGNPLGQLGGTLTKGIISSLRREIYVDGNKMTLLQTDASINNGNSGGGLFDNFGRLVGIVNAKVSASGVEGLGFAIPIEQVESCCFALISSHMHENTETKPQLEKSNAIKWKLIFPKSLF